MQELQVMRLNQARTMMLASGLPTLVFAGDAFNGALAVALSDGLPFDEALRWGTAGGALAVTQPGAQPAMPSRRALLTLLASE